MAAGYWLGLGDSLVVREKHFAGLHFCFAVEIAFERKPSIQAATFWPQLLAPFYLGIHKRPGSGRAFGYHMKRRESVPARFEYVEFHDVP